MGKRILLAILVLACLALAGCTMGEVYSEDNGATGRTGWSIPILAPAAKCQEAK